jgi:hypothetical protein
MFRSFGIRVHPSGRMSAQAVASWFHDFNATADASRLGVDISMIAALTQAERARKEGAVADDADRHFVY